MKMEEINNVNHKIYELAKPLKNKEKTRVLFVCLGNICRSPAADGIMHAIVEREGVAADWDIDSAGTARYHIGELPDHRMRLHARRRGLDLTHRARQVETADFDRYDLIIGMDSVNVADLRRLAPSPEAERKVHAMAEFFAPGERYDYVPDPYYEGAEGFELVLDLLEDSCQRLFNQLSRRNSTR